MAQENVDPALKAAGNAKKQSTLRRFFQELPDEQARLDQHERLLEQVALQTPPASPTEQDRRPVGRPPKLRLVCRSDQALASLQAANKKRKSAKAADKVGSLYGQPLNVNELPTLACGPGATSDVLQAEILRSLRRRSGRA